MNVVGKISVALTGVTGVAGGGILVHKLVNKNDSYKNVSQDLKQDTIANHIKKEYLLTSEDSDKWSKRISLLKRAEESRLGPDLLILKKKDTSLTVKDLQDWCSNNLKDEFKGEKDSQFLNVKLYCGLNIGDKIIGVKVNSETEDGNAKLKEHVNTLKGKTKEDLGEELFAVTGKSNTEDPWEGNKALKQWCLSIFDLAFEESRDYNNAKLYCVTS